MNSIEGDKIFQIKLACSLISDFLKKNNLTYTQSVFLPEIGLQELFSENELMGHFNDKIMNYETSDDSLLINLLKTINKKLQSRKDEQSVSIQTDPEINLDIDEKLRIIDSKYLSKVDLEKLMPSRLMEERNMKFQKELEARMKNDMLVEVIDC
jgi:hypothetical protein